MLAKTPTLIITEFEDGSLGAEAIAARYDALMRGIPTVSCSINKLEHHEEALKTGLALPVGSVEFLLRCMELSGKKQPPPISYPEQAQKHLHRKVWRTTRNQVLTGQFVKPYQTKIFTGFVLGDPENPQDNEEEFERTPLDTVVWAAEQVSFLSEWRFYIQDGQILGYARYDPDGEDDAPNPDPDVVSECILDVHEELGHPFACDVGVLSNGLTAIVEVNDAWAIGLYGKCLQPREYTDFLFARWKSIP